MPCSPTCFWSSLINLISRHLVIRDFLFFILLEYQQKPSLYRAPFYDELCNLIMATKI